jgi:hypothetical protein
MDLSQNYPAHGQFSQWSLGRLTSEALTRHPSVKLSKIRSILTARFFWWGGADSENRDLNGKRSQEFRVRCFT